MSSPSPGVGHELQSAHSALGLNTDMHFPRKIGEDVIFSVANGVNKGLKDVRVEPYIRPSVPSSPLTRAVCPLGLNTDMRFPRKIG